MQPKLLDAHPETLEAVSGKYEIHRNQSKQSSYVRKRTYVADFETTTILDDCRVWGWGCIALAEKWEDIALDQVAVGTTLDSFIEDISQSNTTCYFHNLRFDGKFILDWLLNNGYEHQTNIGRGNGIKPGRFKTLISDMGQFYSITVAWENGFHTEFRDSAKKLPMTVKRIAESFQMEQMKGEIDYDAPRPVGYCPTDAEFDYIRRDVWIVARAIGQQIKQGMQKLTVGADALAEFKQLIGKKRYDRLFPVFSLSMDAQIRKAYRGGFTYADPRFKGSRQGAGMVFDVNSLYPSVMYYQPIPYGEPEFIMGRVSPTRSHPLTIFTITFTAKLKLAHIPCIQVKGSMMFVETEYLTEVKEPTTLTMTNVDYELMCDHYDVQVLSWESGWRFRAANGIFDTYIDKWSRIKANSIGGIREIAKLHLNSLYGKFATRPDVTGKIPYLDDTGTVRLKGGPSETRNPVYTAAGVFITAYARDVTIRAAQANYDAFAYADTDSLHLLTVSAPKAINVHHSELGAWKHEYNFEEAYYIRAKAYFEREASGRYHNAVAGVPVHISAALTFDDLVPGTEIVYGKHEVTRRAIDPSRGVLLHGKLNPKSVPGGVVLQDTPYELKLA